VFLPLPFFIVSQNGLFKASRCPDKANVLIDRQIPVALRKTSFPGNGEARPGCRYTDFSPCGTLLRRIESKRWSVFKNY